MKPYCDICGIDTRKGMSTANTYNFFYCWDCYYEFISDALDVQGEQETVMKKRQEFEEQKLELERRTNYGITDYEKKKINDIFKSIDTSKRRQCIMQFLKE